MTPFYQELLIAVVKIAVVIGTLLGAFSLMTWIERRTLAFMQYRLGPNRTGPFGILQPVADGIKLFFKEEAMPAAADKWTFLAAPVVAVATALLATAVIPYGPPFSLPGWSWLPDWLQGRDVQILIADLEVGLLFIFAVTALGVYGLVLAGWAANSKYSLLGGLRSSAQMFSYELALGFSWVTVIMAAQSFRINDIVAEQAGLVLELERGRALPGLPRVLPRRHRRGAPASPSTCPRARASSWPASTPSTRRCASP